MLFLIAVPILFIVLGLPGIFGLPFILLAPSPSAAVEAKLSVLSSSVTSLLIIGPIFLDCIGVMFGVSNTPGVGSAAASLRCAVFGCSRGFAFSGTGVASSVESRIGARVVVGAGLSGALSSEPELRGRESEESRIWLQIRDLRSSSRRMRL